MRYYSMSPRSQHFYGYQGLGLTETQGQEPEPHWTTKVGKMLIPFAAALAIGVGAIVWMERK